MFKAWIELFKERSLISKILRMYQEMIKDARWMFVKMGATLMEGGDPDRWGAELKARDQALNETEQRLRKMIVEHLSINPTRDLGSSLIFFSGVKDAERLGDYCKNLHEVAVLQKGRPFPARFHQKVNDIFANIERQFEKTSRSFTDWDVQLAQSVMDDLKHVKKECADIVEDILRDPGDLDVREAVSTTLTVRYLKRVAGHISNIASGVLNPAHKIDYYKPNEK